MATSRGSGHNVFGPLRDTYLGQLLCRWYRTQGWLSEDGALKLKMPGGLSLGHPFPLPPQKQDYSMMRLWNIKEKDLHQAYAQRNDDLGTVPTCLSCGEPAGTCKCDL